MYIYLRVGVYLYIGVYFMYSFLSWGVLFNALASVSSSCCCCCSCCFELLLLEHVLKIYLFIYIYVYALEVGLIYIYILCKYNMFAVASPFKNICPAGGRSRSWNHPFPPHPK